MLLLSNSNVFFIRQISGANRRWQAISLWLILLSIPSYAQGGFVSGSTGADGAFNPTSNVTVQLPESGVLNFTTINIPTSVTVRFGKNSRNTPVTILATGNVTIAGTIDISGSNGASVLGGAGGPGGFNGGNGGIGTSSSVYSPGVSGDGPGGGGGAASSNSPGSAGAPGGGGFGTPGQDGLLTADQVATGFTIVNGAGGPRYGLPTLLPLIGGSGGGGEVGQSGPGGGGGGGGGAILIASSGTMSFTSNTYISARGGFGHGQQIAQAGGGSGGAVRLIANVISGTLRIDAAGGQGRFGGTGGGGYIRIEAFDLNALSLNLIGSPRVSTTTPKAVTASNLPVIRIASVAGVAPPTIPNGSLQGGPDITLPGNQPNPVAVALSASNIPLGTILQIILTPENGARIVTQSTALTGTLAASTATANVVVPDGISVIQASGTIDVAAGQSLTVNGEKVKQIEVSAIYGGDTVVTYVTESNKRVRAVR
jgi:hypothetical protein